MLFTVSIYLSLMICLGGLVYRIGRWFRLEIGATNESTSPQSRLGSAATGVLGIVFSRRIGKILHALLFEILLQHHLLKQNLWRWLFHMCLFYGILLLVFLHALDDHITRAFFPSYVSTLNPYLFLRNLLGALILAGIGFALLRRRSVPALRRYSSVTDYLTLALLTLIVISGIFLEGAQIISPTIFDQMVLDYMGEEDPEAVAPLKAYWAAEFEVAFPGPADPVDESLLPEGRGLHRDFCAECHSRPHAAFISYPFARAIKPMAGWVDEKRLDLFLWYVHFLVSFAALAYLPFSKFFHLVSTPISLLVRAAGETTTNRPINRLTRRAMGLDACTHCGICSQHCSVEPVFRIMSNRTILPSEKLAEVAKMAANSSHDHTVAFSEGSNLCTQCGRCTKWCPAGIDLQDLWQASLKDLAQAGYPEPHSWIRTQSTARWADIAEERGPVSSPLPPVRLADDPESFWACVQCTTCTSVCPVVAASDDTRQVLDMTPQQIMNLLRMQMKEMALGCKMVWDCVTCYKCQEHCPQGVKVADVLYELRNEACSRLKPTGAVRPDTVSSEDSGTEDDK